MKVQMQIIGTTRQLSITLHEMAETLRERVSSGRTRARARSSAMAYVCYSPVTRQLRLSCEMKSPPPMTGLSPTLMMSRLSMMFVPSLRQDTPLTGDRPPRRVPARGSGAA